MRMRKIIGILCALLLVLNTFAQIETGELGGGDQLKRGT